MRKAKKNEERTIIIGRKKAQTGRNRKKHLETRRKKEDKK